LYAATYPSLATMGIALRIDKSLNGRSTNQAVTVPSRLGQRGHHAFDSRFFEKATS
jgi:hypothetical protein